MLKYVSIGAIALVLSSCATTEAGRQSEREQADQLFGKAKVAMMVASVAVSGYNVACAGNLRTSRICAPNVVAIVNKALKGASDALVAAEQVFAGINSTTDQRMQAVNAAVAAVGALTKAVADYVPAGLPPSNG